MFALEQYMPLKHATVSTARVARNNEEGCVYFHWYKNLLWLLLGKMEYTKLFG